MPTSSAPQFIDPAVVRLELADAAFGATVARTAAGQLAGLLSLLHSKSETDCSAEELSAYVRATLLVAKEALDTITSGSDGCVDEINRAGVKLFGKEIRPAKGCGQ